MQTALGAVVVLTTTTMDRVMVVELALPGVLPGALVALHYAVQMLRRRLEYGSDVGGMAVLAVGDALAAVATAPPWCTTGPLPAARGVGCARAGTGADGADSGVARQALPASERVPYVAAYHEILRTPAGAGFDRRRCDAYYQSRVSPDVYGWVFAHGDTTSVGVVSAVKGLSPRAVVQTLREASGRRGAGRSCTMRRTHACGVDHDPPCTRHHERHDGRRLPLGRRGFVRPPALPALAPGDVVDVVAPASATSMERVEAGCEVLRGWGLVPRLPRQLFGRGFLDPDDDAARAAQLLRALRACDSRVVWAARGGYGCTRLLPRLARGRAPAAAKLLVGFSDLTALQGFVAQQWRWPSLHAPNVAHLAEGALPRAHLYELRRVLTGRITSSSHGGLRPLNEPAARAGEVLGRLRGGNLKLCQSLLGTPWRPRWREAVVVLEDVDERAYSVDRMLVQLQQSGVLRGVRGLVFGDFTRGEEADGAARHHRVFANFAQRVPFPVFSGLAFGHGARLRPLLFGCVARLECKPRGRLSLTWRTQP